MRRKLYVEPVAEREAEEAAAWYDEREPGLGAVFVAKFRDVLSRISARPESFSPVLGIEIEPPVRSAPMKPYSYRVVFVTEGDVLRVISVFHVRRDPARLHKRITGEDEPPVA